MPSSSAMAPRVAGPTSNNGDSGTGAPSSGLGSPQATSSIIRAIPTKITARSATTATASQVYPAAMAAPRMVTSLRNSPKGGEPVTANNPATSSMPDQGER